MSLSYRAVDWNRQKRVYDLTFGGLVVLGLGAFIGAFLVTNPNVTAETLIIRGSGFGAIALLHGILCLGPLARLDRRFLPLLYNRRHLGVTMFLLAAVHGVFALIQFHALGDENPLVSLFTAYGHEFVPRAGSDWNLARVPFEPFGVLALAILFVMAATSHDFWLRQLGASFWKCLHLGVYLAYGAVLAHVALGFLQSERDPVPAGALIAGFGIVAGLHLAAARKERRRDGSAPETAARGTDEAGFVDAGAAAELEEGRGRVVSVGGERLAVWRHGGRYFATGNVCRHQGGPLGEGRILDGCITCPWHGWTYQPEDGCSPPPFTEVVETHEVRVAGGRLRVRRTALPPRTRSAGATVGAAENPAES